MANKSCFDDDDIIMLRLMWEVGYIQINESLKFQLTSNILSPLYIGVRRYATIHTELLWRMGEKINRELPFLSQVLLGVPSAGVPLATFAAAASHVVAQKCGIISHSFVMTHKERPYIDVNYNARNRYWLIENVTTSGKSVIDFAKALRKHKRFVRKKLSLLVLVDRGQGAIAKLEHEFAEVRVCFHLKDMMHAYHDMRLWTERQLRVVMDEVI